MAEKPTESGAEIYSIGERNGTYFTELNGGHDPQFEKAFEAELQRQHGTRDPKTSRD